MRSYKIYGLCDGEIDHPIRENIRVRARRLADKRTLRLCDFCLRTRRCYERPRGVHKPKSWKHWRAKQYKMPR